MQKVTLGYFLAYFIQFSCPSPTLSLSQLPQDIIQKIPSFKTDNAEVTNSRSLS